MDKTEETYLFLPRKGSFEYNFLLADKEKQKKFLKRFKFLNSYITKPLYKSGIMPFFGFGRLFILVYTKGRKTGKQRITPVEYQTIEGEMYIFAGRGKKADWLKNMLANPEDVKIKKGFKTYPIIFEVIEQDEEVTRIFKWFVTNVKILPLFIFGWRKRKDNIKKADFSFIAKNLSVIKIKNKF